ncbi:endonuclease NucS domain-containing protein [Paenibacillus turpanensis]|uniref:endonuclease NucS domain-containing protein n=1 Tax=Paenibacillus turpanensis TaxID=2689078 RepID=UPI00140D1783|nr:endonuclease NucS domain-containing protein [Paenibacillus turpanensis]
MFFSVNKNNNALHVYEETDFKSNNVLERNHIEDWVIKKPEILGEELYILTNEYDKFDKTSERLDVLALDKQGNLVIIELKRDDSGKDVELQAVKYAAYCSTLTVEEILTLHREYLKKENVELSIEDVKTKIEDFLGAPLDKISDRPRIILVSREYRPEVTATVLWLRKFGIDITCVKFTVYKLNDSEIGVFSNILIPLPEAEEYIIRAEKKEHNENEMTSQDRLKIDFLNKLKTATVSKLKIDDNLIKVNHNYKYLQIKTTHSSIHFEFCFRGRNSLEIGLHFEKSNDDCNNQKVRELKSRFESELINVFNQEVVFEEDWTSRKWARISIVNSTGSIDESLFNWAIDNMKAFYEKLINEL